MAKYEEKLVRVAKQSKRAEDKLRVSLIEDEKREKVLMKKVAKLEGRLASESKTWRSELADLKADLKSKLQEAKERASRVVKEYLVLDHNQCDLAEYRFKAYEQGFEDVMPGSRDFFHEIDFNILDEDATSLIINFLL
ncbi:hypothetical protein COCNU_07G013540 [Cocos nucifera]|uniref:Uncharacterized protein n=1 Tax=Cocos nucifera TaxID=13894 RepID=A0A8K0IGK3_COCNU|nr:hypothetical protein COCNU_07G013540 [Cocos nucifera]